MVFTSHIFIYYFLPLVLLLYYNFPYRWRNQLLTLSSYVFYAWWKPWFVVLMLFSTCVDYGCGRWLGHPGIRPRRRQAILALSVTANLGLLGFFKYYMFAAENLNVLLESVGAPTFQVLVITLPIGISFYTFQSLSYTVDVYRRKAPPVGSFADFACYVSLFPQLIAGPIVRYNEIASQLHSRVHTLGRFSSGVAVFVVGFAKKLLLADPMGDVADLAFSAHSVVPLDAWFGVIAYAFQIYFDFSAYSEMAVGLGRMFGFEFPWNFDAPYRAESLSDFWRRWHISLSTWLRDYLYLPLGGNRKGRLRTYGNLAVVMLLGGLWHGAQWTFLAWGAFHGILLIVERLQGKRSAYRGLPRPLRVACTFLLVLVGWVLFRAESLAEAGAYLGSMLGLSSPGTAAPLLAAQLYSRDHLLVFVLCACLVWQPLQARNWVGVVDARKALVLLLLFVAGLIAMAYQEFSPFLYFQF